MTKPITTLATLALLTLTFASATSHAIPAWVQPAPAKARDCPTAVERMLNFTKDGVVHKGEIVGDRLMVVGKDGKSVPAADGTYAMPDGQKLVVKNGKIAQKTVAGKS